MGGKKRHGCLITLLVFVLIVAGGFFGIRFYLQSQIPDQVDYSRKDKERFYEKLAIEPDNYEFDMMDLLTGNVELSGRIDVDDTFSSEELTAFFQGHSKDYVMENSVEQFLASIPNPLEWMTLKAYARGSDVEGLFTDFNVRILDDDELEVFANVADDMDDVYDIIDGLEDYSFIVDRAAGATIHITMKLTFDEEDGFDVKVRSIRVAGVKVPESLVEEYEPALTDLLNGAIDQVDYFAVYAFEIDDDEIYFRGVLPEYINVKQ